MKPSWPIVILIAGGVGLVALLAHKLETIEEQVSRANPGDRGPAPPVEVQGAALYVPAYSHVRDRSGKPLLLETTLSVRNIDPERKLKLTAVRYYDTTGHEVRSMLSGPRVLGPFETAEFRVPYKDLAGGSGANFLVEWDPEDVRNPPLTQAVHIGLNAPQSISFICEGRLIDLSGQR